MQTAKYFVNVTPCNSHYGTLHSEWDNEIREFVTISWDDYDEVVEFATKRSRMFPEELFHIVLYTYGHFYEVLGSALRGRFSTEIQFV